jgi:hypothetical protein
MFVLMLPGSKPNTPFFWNGYHWVHCQSCAKQFPTAAEAEVERWSKAGTDADIGRLA